MAAKSLGNLSMHYPNPINNKPAITMTDARKEGIPTAQEIIDEFPSVFDGQVKSRVMDGKQFHIALAKNVIPFCVKTSDLCIQGQIKGRVRVAAATWHYSTCNRGHTLV